MDPNQVPQNPNGIAGKPEPTLHAGGKALESLQAANTIPGDLPKPDIQDSIKNLHKEGDIPTLRTFQSDIADAAKQKDNSPVKIALAGNQDRIGNRQEVINDPKRSAFTLILSIILILGGVTAGITYVYIQLRVKEAPTPIVKQNEIISTELVKNIPIGHQQSTMTAFVQELSAPAGTQNSLTKLQFIEATESKDVEQKPLDAQAFASQLKTQMPAWLIRALQPSYLAGTHYFNGWHPFIIFKTDSYENSFSGMLSWENTIKNDLSAWIQHQLATTQTGGGLTTSIAAGLTSTSTATTTPRPALPATGFQDFVIRNKDTRVLRDAAGNIVLLYSLPDKETIIITTDENTFKEIITRLTNSQFVR